MGETKRGLRRMVWFGLAVLVAVGLFFGLKHRRSDPPYVPPPRTVVDDSTKLERTVIVPTLDAPLPPGKNAIWCASFQLAWNHLRDDVIKEPIKIANAEAVAQRLNTAPLTEKDLPAGSFYATAGKVTPALLKKIADEMAAKFPGVATPKFPALEAQDLLAYAYMKAGVKFAVPFADLEYALTFKDSAGRETPATGFGMYPHRLERANERLAEQIEVLLASGEAYDYSQGEFALDLDRNSKPVQLILACVKPGESLVATLADLERKMAAWPGHGDMGRKFGGADSLAVPNLNWTITHRFKELEGEDKRLLNAGFTSYYIALAEQMIDFRLDRSGAMLTSEAELAAKACMGRAFSFTKPFLIVMKLRGAANPFFVMWVDNAELLCRVEEKKP